MSTIVLTDQAGTSKLMQYHCTTLPKLFVKQASTVMVKYRYAVIFLSLLLLGCQPEPMCLEVVDVRSNSLTLDFTKDQDCRPSPKISSITVVREFDKTTLWYISTDTQDFEKEEIPTSLDELGNRDVKYHRPEGRQLSTVTYGVIPDGFRGSTAEKLHPGEIIKIFVRGQIGQVELSVTVRSPL